MCQHGRRQECGRQHRGGGQEQLQDVPLPFAARHNRHGSPVGRQRRGKQKKQNVSHPNPP
nr:MAG TPA: hypothetical protein [Caudoviricetes sp.]